MLLGEKTQTKQKSVFRAFLCADIQGICIVVMRNASKGSLNEQVLNYGVMTLDGTTLSFPSKATTFSQAQRPKGQSITRFRNEAAITFYYVNMKKCVDVNIVISCSPFPGKLHDLKSVFSDIVIQWCRVAAASGQPEVTSSTYKNTIT